MQVNEKEKNSRTIKDKVLLGFTLRYGITMYCRSRVFLQLIIITFTERENNKQKIKNRVYINIHYGSYKKPVSVIIAIEINILN